MVSLSYRCSTQMHRPTTRASKLARLTTSARLGRTPLYSQCLFQHSPSHVVSLYYHPPVDPLKIVAKELKFLTKNIRSLLGSGHPMLDTVAKYYTQSEGKYVRPMLVLLMSRATACIPSSTSSYTPPRQEMINTPISPSKVLFETNRSQDP